MSAFFGIPPPAREPVLAQPEAESHLLRRGDLAGLRLDHEARDSPSRRDPPRRGALAVNEPRHLEGRALHAAVPRRFIDTTTASPWRECYHPEHPQTRGESKRAKMELLRVVSEEMGLVTGSETGHDAALPHVHYFEGMMSLGPYRVPGAGRDMTRIWQEVPDEVARFQLGHRYRLPLWELVYHDCVVATWYWGDYSNKLPTLWDKRDLFNVLYATPPMFMFTRRFWEENGERFADSYRAIAPLVRAVGYAEMLDHRFLTADRNIQQTRFSTGHIVTVNFSAEPYVLADGTRIDGMGFHIQD